MMLLFTLLLLCLLWLLCDLNIYIYNIYNIYLLFVLIFGELEIVAVKSSLFILLPQQAYTNSLPSTLLASTVQNAREDLSYSPFPVTQSMPTKYSNVASSISGPTISMPEVPLCSSLLNSLSF
jgi:hypothetical protein